MKIAGLDSISGDGISRRIENLSNIIKLDKSKKWNLTKSKNSNLAKFKNSTLPKDFVKINPTGTDFLNSEAK